jgi:twitching motility protein PilT
VHIDDLLTLAVEKRASDLHLKVPRPPVLRIVGELITQDELAPLTSADVEGVLASIASPEQIATFRRDWELDLAYSISGVGRFRVNACMQRGSMALSFRPIPLVAPRIDELGLPDAAKYLASRLRGFVLVTGPTGSGKSTTLAAMIEYINETRSCRIITIEDPIEFLHRDKRAMIVQRELSIDTRSFAVALKHAMRQDPDVILVGEMRDLETIRAAVTAAETGHLVLATLHTVNVAQTVDRVIDVFPAHQQAQIRLQLSGLLEGIMCQNLLPSADGKERILATEVMIGTPATANLIREAKAFQLPTTLQTGAQLGMQTLDQSLRVLVQKKQITLQTALSSASNPDELRKLLAQRGPGSAS